MHLASRSLFRLAMIAILPLPLLTPGSSSAAVSVPSPANSLLPGCFSTSPNGALPSIVVVRDLASNLVPGSMVVLDYYQCPDFVPCAQTGNPPDDYIVDVATKTIRMTTNGLGQAVFYLRAGGSCSIYNIRVFADGVFLGSRPSASTDQDGDLSVDPADLALLQAKVGTSDLTGDLSCDSVVDNYDVSILVDALGSSCQIPTSARHSTWGRVKVTYR